MFKLSPQQKRTRQRGKNFSPSEEMMLMELLQPYKEIINNKRSDAATCQMKKTAWEQLASQFSIQTGMSRSWRTLKDKYKNMNTKMKIEGKRVPGSMLSQDMDESAGSCVSVVYNQESAQKYAKTFAQAPHPAFSFGGEGDSFANTFSRRVEEEEEPAEEPIGSTESSPVQPTEMSYSEVTECVPPPTVAVNKGPQRYVVKRKRSLYAEKMKLIRYQQKYYRDENARAAKKHRLEVKAIHLKTELLTLELKEKRLCIGKYGHSTLEPVSPI